MILDPDAQRYLIGVLTSEIDAMPPPAAALTRSDPRVACPRGRDPSAIVKP
jgi:hypothetical protein